MPDEPSKPAAVKILTRDELKGDIVRRQRHALNKGGSFHIVMVRGGAIHAIADEPAKLSPEAVAEIGVVLAGEIKHQAALAASKAKQ